MLVPTFSSPSGLEAPNDNTTTFKPARQFSMPKHPARALHQFVRLGRKLVFGTMRRCSSRTEEIQLKKRERYHIARVWASYEQLVEESASCDFCALCHHYLRNSCTQWSLEQTPGQVRLTITSDNIQLTSPAFPGALNLRIQELHGGSQREVCQYKPRYLEFARNWLRQCQTQHHRECWGTPPLNDHCTQVNVLSGPPRRLIDLSECETVRVIDCKDWIEAGLCPLSSLQEYVTLSYRWGNTDPSYALRKPFKTLLELPVDSMPRTLTDAFTVARALGCRYIWVDALCIVQPTTEDETDWRSEGPRMGIIYQNSLCTIAATCALHADDGFLARTGSGIFPAGACSVPRITAKDDGTTVTDQVHVCCQPPPPFMKASLCLL